MLVFLGGALSEFVFSQVGLGATTAAVWRYARWPAALLAMILIYAVVYFAAPNVEIRRFQWITPGALFGVLAWLLASAAFFLYVANFGSYQATYGAFAATVILLVWLWLTNVVLLFGAELNAVIDLRRSPHLSERYDGPPLPPKEPADAYAGERHGGWVGEPSTTARDASSAGAERALLAISEHSARRPGQSAHSSRCGRSVTS